MTGVFNSVELSLWKQRTSGTNHVFCDFGIVLSPDEKHSPILFSDSGKTVTVVSQGIAPKHRKYGGLETFVGGLLFKTGGIVLSELPGFPTARGAIDYLAQADDPSKEFTYDWYAEHGWDGVVTNHRRDKDHLADPGRVVGREVCNSCSTQRISDYINRAADLQSIKEFHQLFEV